MSFSTIQSKLMLLQLRKRQKRFISKINGELIKKGSSRSIENERLIIQQINNAMKKVNWRYVPRAKIGINIHFNANNSNIPGLPKLVKYFLDILSKIAFHDDRQIEYLTACCYRPLHISSKLSKHKNSIFVEVERLVDFKEKFLLYRSLIGDDEFCDYAKSSQLFEEYFKNEDSEIEKMWPDEESAKYFNLTPEVVKSWHNMIRMNNQQKLLSRNKIDIYDWQDVFKDPLYKVHKEFWNLNPFIFEVEGLPTSGSKSKYKERLRVKLQKLNELFPKIGKVIAPLELDVQVRPKSSNLKKDLDNIMLHISSIFSDELLDESSYIHGYRIYVTKPRDEIETNGSLRFKLLPLFAINDFISHLNKTLELGVEWLEKTSDL